MGRTVVVELLWDVSERTGNIRQEEIAEKLLY